MDRKFVDSSSLEWVGYDAEKELLVIRFVSGGLYEYSEVPADVYEALMAAESKGRFFRSRIRGEYDYVKLN
ncbi:MAG: KTSC domain-containing protein [Acidobacteria bacterium]|nr:KTSC domain-containing protein [Acidobacteriota bacterium]